MDPPISRRLAATIAVALACSVAAGQESLRRATIWDLKVGQPISAQPSSDEFRGLACGSNGGAPRQPLAGWKDFARCRAEPDGLHEVYFEYDDELEYIARAKDIDREITRWAGTTEGESAIGALFVKQDCEMNDAAAGRRVLLRVRFFRKKGQSGVNPQLPTQLTEGQFESSTRLEVYQNR
jgi:hypothetical protein